MKKENIAILQMLGCAALWSLAGILMKLVPWNAFAVSGIRSLIAGATIGAYMLWKKFPLTISKKTLLAGILAGCTYTCFTCANKLTTAANAIVLQFIAPVLIVFYSAVLFKTKVKKADILVSAFAMMGIALFFLDQLKPGYILGNLVAILAGMFMAGMYMSIGGLEAEQRFSAVFIAQIFTFLVGLPFIIATKPVFTPVATISILVLGIFQLGLAYVLYVKASKYCPPLACSLLGAVEPLLNPVWVMLFVGEKPGIFAFIGGIIVIVSVTLWCIYGNKEKAEANA